ncbi:MAG: acetate/propionate family kinase [Candidatus Competibacteraceae bacterium]|nr:acetate/propionate family kinase [Candidatus Competibacteraceae bacterium]
MNNAILVLNAGSSSLKFSLYRLGAALHPVYHGQVEGIGTSPHLLVQEGQRLVAEERWQEGGHDRALARLLDWLDRTDRLTLRAVGHRVVHGGTALDKPVVVDDQVLAKLESLVPLAPLHQPHNLAGIRAVRASAPQLPQVACFDTAFHRRHPREADLFALPWTFYEQGIRRYGFHGLSYEAIARALPRVAPDIARGRVVVAHLGSGASLCALRDGVSIDSTMGLTALDGLPMGTRTGALDPGVVLYLIQNRGLDIEQLEDLLYRRSGLLGLSGVSNDMRQLLESDQPRAALAVDYFVYRIRREIGALAAALGGLDGLVFTAGIGEAAAPIRARVCRELTWLGVTLDEPANQKQGPRISAPGSRVQVWVIPTDEEGMIARHTVEVLGL